METGKMNVKGKCTFYYLISRFSVIKAEKFFHGETEIARNPKTAAMPL